MNTATITLPETFKLEATEPVFRAFGEALEGTEALHLDGSHCTSMDYAAVQLLIAFLHRLEGSQRVLTAELSDTVLEALDDLSVRSLLEAAMASPR
ncbi:MAG: STAS domain-containing protein [Pseudomonadota bacterium]